MSSGKRFDKTLIKKEETNINEKNNKSNNSVKKAEDDEEKEEYVLISQLKSSSSSSSSCPKNKKKTGPTTAQKVNNNRKNKEEGGGVKQNLQNDGKDETLTKKRKAENGVLKKEKNPKTAAKAKKSRKEKEETSECAFPMNRIMRIVKSEGTSDFKISGEAVFLINKAAEKFIELFSKDAYDSAVEDRKSFVGYKHLASAVCKKKRLDFLSDFVPEKVAAEKALAERKPAETLPG